MNTIILIPGVERAAKEIYGKLTGYAANFSDWNELAKIITERTRADLVVELCDRLLTGHLPNCRCEYCDLARQIQAALLDKEVSDAK